jgi:hypothetical protein
MRLSRPPDKYNTQPQRRQVNATHWMQVNDLDSHSARREAVTLSSRFFTLLEIRINQGNSQRVGIEAEGDCRLDSYLHNT